MKVVLDTNVVISAAINPSGVPAQILQAWTDARFEWVLSPSLLLELRRVFAYDRVRRLLAWTAAEVETFISSLHDLTTVVEPTAVVLGVLADPADDALLEAAVESGADYVVTGDKGVLDLGQYAGVGILTPAQFLALLV